MKGKEIIGLGLVSWFVLWLNDGHWFGYALVLLLFAVTFACILIAPARAHNAHKLALQKRELELAEQTLALRKTEMEQAARAAARAARLQEIEAKQAYWARVTEEEARAAARADWDRHRGRRN
jgi:hypothetical protein